MMRYESPAKRPRMVPSEVENNSREIVESIHRAVTASQRFEIVHRLFQKIKYDVNTRSCHGDPQVFNCLVESGVTNSLCIQLGFLLHRHGSSREEIGLVCTAIDVFCRFSPTLTTESYLRARGKEVTKLLIGAYRRGVILPVISIWHSCSSSEQGTLLLIEEPLFLPSVVDAFKIGLSECDILLEALGLLKNATYYVEDFRRRIMEQQSLLLTLTSLAEITLPHKAHERLSAVMRNLALSPSTRVVLAHRADVLTAIIRLANGATPQTLRNLMNTMVSLAIDADSCLLIIFHGDGMLITMLKRLLFYEEDAAIRKRAARTLRLMARETTVPLLIHDDKLMDTLSNRAIHDSCSEVRAEAAEAFGRCAGLIKAAMGQHDAVLDALTQLASSPHVPPDVMARAVMEQARHPENRASLAKRTKLLTTLAHIALSSKSSTNAKENVCNTFLNLSTDNCSHETLTNQIVLTALVHNADNNVESHTLSREISVRALVNLASSSANAKLMAKHPRLIQSLLQFAATTSQDELKKEVKLVLLTLTAEL